MKRTLLILLSAFCLAFVPSGPTTITLAWNYQQDIDAFYVYQSTNVTAAMPWQPCTNTAASSVTIQVMPGRMFYYVTASNFWGESGPSNTIGTPAVPAATNVTVRRP
jgi:hypothetical protein